MPTATGRQPTALSRTARKTCRPQSQELTGWVRTGRQAASVGGFKVSLCGVGSWCPGEGVVLGRGGRDWPVTIGPLCEWGGGGEPGFAGEPEGPHRGMTGRV